MRQVKLSKLVLNEFQGGNFTLSANGEDTFIFGENASGKTRLVSAFTWLLFGKDALGRSDFQIKNLDAQGEPEHNLQHSVEAVLQIDGEAITLKKTLSEVWQKKRGSTKATFTGHTNEFYIDGVPTQKKLFDEKVAEIAGSEETFKLLTSPTVFPNLPWQKARAILLEVCGDISDADVIASDEKLAPLPNILGKKTIDDLRKIITVRRTEINKELSMIPVRIDENRLSLPDVTGIDRGEAEKEIQHFETSLNDAKLRLQGVNTGGNIADLTKQLSGFNADLRKMEDTHRSGSLFTLNRLNQQISEVEAMANASHRRGQVIDSDLKQKDGQFQRLDSDLSRLRGQWTVIDAEIFKDTISDTCPACGQSLPSERVQAAREKALATFNESKAERLGEINRRGKDLREQRDRLEGEIDALKKEREIVSLNLPDAEGKLKTLTEERDSLKHSSEDFSGVQNRTELLDEIEDMESQIKTEREGKTQDVDKIKGEISALQTELFAAKSKIDMFTRREQGERRIEELKIIEKQLSAEFEKLEQELFLTELFIRTKVSMLSERINSKFEIVKWKLYDVQVNGALSECCVATVNGIPFDAGLNSGGRTQAGMDIIRTLQRHFQMKAVTWVDNREGCTEIPSMECQVISLYVSPDDKKLRVETVGKG